MYIYFYRTKLIIMHEDPNRKLLKYLLYNDDRKTLPSRLKVMVLLSERIMVFGNDKSYVFQKE